MATRGKRYLTPDPFSFLSFPVLGVAAGGAIEETGGVVFVSDGGAVGGFGIDRAAVGIGEVYGPFSVAAHRGERVAEGVEIGGGGG